MGPGPNGTRAQMGPGPNGARPNGTGPNGTRAQTGPAQWDLDQMGPGQILFDQREKLILD